MEQYILAQYPTGAIIDIGGLPLALEAWDEDRQLSADEIVYAGYTEGEWRHATDASQIVVQRLRDGQDCLTRTGAAYDARFHDEGGLRVVGRWYGGDTAGDHTVAGDAYELWSNEEANA